MPERGIVFGGYSRIFGVTTAKIDIYFVLVCRREHARKPHGVGVYLSSVRYSRPLRVKGVQGFFIVFYLVAGNVIFEVVAFGISGNDESEVGRVGNVAAGSNVDVFGLTVDGSLLCDSRAPVYRGFRVGASFAHAETDGDYHRQNKRCQQNERNNFFTCHKHISYQSFIGLPDVHR